MPAPAFLTNTYVTHEGVRYEIFWSTQYAAHILENYIADRDGGVHRGLDHKLVAQIVRKAIYILPEEVKPELYLHVFLAKMQGKVYEAYVYLVPELDGKPARCVIKTCYVSNKHKYRDLFIRQS
jgi:hypothetical protein